MVELNKEISIILSDKVAEAEIFLTGSSIKIV